MNKLDRLFSPKSVAVIGGGTWCENVIKSLKAMGFSGELFSVHPSKTQISGVTCYPSVDALPSSPDACFVGVNRNLSIEVVRALYEKNAGGVVAFASGFSEASAEDASAINLQAELVIAAGDMPLLGPNCYGFINYLDGALLWPDQHGGTRVDRGVAIITQSSNIAINLTMQRRGLPIAYMVTVGNQAQMGLSRLAMHLLDDDRVSAIGLYIEGVDDIEAFQELARRAEALGKPIVAIKVGKSDHAQRATASHTASLAGSDAGARALFWHLGIAQVESLTQLIEALKIAHVNGKLKSKKIVSMSCSGGEASLVADSAAGLDLEFPALSAKQNDDLLEALGPLVARSNPLDYNTYIWGDTAKMTATFTAMLSPDLGMGFVVLDLPRSDRCDPAAWLPVIDCMKNAQLKTQVPAAIMASFPENMPEDIAHKIMALGLVPLFGIDDGLRAIEAMSHVRPRANQANIIHCKMPVRVELIDEFEAKKVLRKFGINVPNSVRANTIFELKKSIENLQFPLALKGLGIAHKSEAGAVHLNIQDTAMLLEKAKAFAAESYIIEEMIEGGLVELLLGIVLDPAHGYVLTIAAGGVFTEIWKDSVSLSVPASQDDIISAIQTLKIYPILCGFRGKEKINLCAVVDAVEALQEYVSENKGKVSEVEINPLICTKRNAIAADVLIKLGEPNEQPRT